jgi:hypothetical protein
VDEKLAAYGWHIAGQHHIPIAGGVSERGKNAAQRPFPRIPIGEHGISEEAIALGIAYQSHVTGRGGYCTGDVSGERYAAKGEQSFIPAHARAAASDEHVSGAAHTNRRHSKMIPSWISWPCGGAKHLAWHRLATLL